MLRNTDEQTGRAWLFQSTAILFIRMISVAYHPFTNEILTMSDGFADDKQRLIRKKSLQFHTVFQTFSLRKKVMAFGLIVYQYSSDRYCSTIYM